MSFHRVATVLVSILLATTVHADDDFSSVEFCTDLSLIANLIMTARQQDRPMSETLPLATNEIKSWSDKYGIEMDMDVAEEVAAEMVMTAYEETISFGDEFKRQMTTEFENSIFKGCYEETTSDSEE